MKSISSPYVDRGRLRAVLETVCQKGLRVAQLEGTASCLNWGTTVRSAIDISRHLKRPHTFFVTAGFGHIKIRAPGSTLCYAGDFEDICVSKILHFVQGTRLHQGSNTVKVRRSPVCSPFWSVSIFHWGPVLTISIRNFDL